MDKGNIYKGLCLCWQLTVAFCVFPEIEARKLKWIDRWVWAAVLKVDWKLVETVALEKRSNLRVVKSGRDWILRSRSAIVFFTLSTFLCVSWRRSLESEKGMNSGWRKMRSYHLEDFERAPWAFYYKDLVASDLRSLHQAILYTRPVPCSQSRSYSPRALVCCFGGGLRDNLALGPPGEAMKH